MTLTLLSLTLLSAPGISVATSTSVGRSVDVPIKVVLVGFDQSAVDLSYLAWSGDSRNLPSSVVNVDLISGNTTGVVYHPKYDVSFASSSFTNSLVAYLESIGREFNATNPWFGQYQYLENSDYYTSVPMPVEYVVYDANSVEEWLWNQAQEVGGYPDNGWTIILADLHDLPSISWEDVAAFKASNGEVLPKNKPHYYGISHTDTDLGYNLRFRDYMNAWGGHHRMWFVDVSAGPVFNSEWVDLPLQVVIEDNQINLRSDFGKTWLTEYLADYIWEATYNFVAPNFVYFPQYAANYEIDVFVFDDRTRAEKQEVPIENTVNKDAMLAAWQELVPYSSVTVNLKIQDVPVPLHDVIQSSYKYTDSWILGAIFGQPEQYGVVDLRPVYKYVMDDFDSLAPNVKPAHGESYGLFDREMVSGKMTIPVFAFAFSEQTYFSYTYKWFIGDTDWETGALLGIALPEAAFVSLNQWTFTRGNYVDPPQPDRGLGFTQTIIHEVGHEFGLMHPHQYGDIGDFTVSPMGYFTDDYKFGVIDKDALQRAHVDQLYMETENLLNQMPANSNAAGQVQSKLAEAESLYAQMNYSAAIQPVLAAYDLALQMEQSTASAAAQTPIIYLVTGIVVGVILGLAIAMVLKRRKKSKR